MSFVKWLKLKLWKLEEEMKKHEGMTSEFNSKEKCSNNYLPTSMINNNNHSYNSHNNKQKREDQLKWTQCTTTEDGPFNWLTDLWTL